MEFDVNCSLLMVMKVADPVEVNLRCNNLVAVDVEMPLGWESRRQ